LSAHQLRTLWEQGRIVAETLIALQDGTMWAPSEAWRVLDVEAVPPSRHLPLRLDMPLGLGRARPDELNELRWWLRQSGVVSGPHAYEVVIEALEGAETPCEVALVGGECWFPGAELDPSLSAARSEGGFRAIASSASPETTCAFCLEIVPVDARRCPECDEAIAPVSLPDSRTASIVDDAPDASWLKMHWRPLLTMSAMGALVATGIALRHLAPNRYEPPKRLGPAAFVAPSCEDACWHGEACVMGKCLWQPPNDVGHVSSARRIAGPFELPPDVSDVLPLDDNRFAVAYLRGVQITNARTGAVMSLVSDAPQAQHLYRVGETVYTTSPQRIYVMDAAQTRVLKTIELGSSVGNVAVGASGRRVFASIPASHAVAVIATDYHAEVSRFYFGDDTVEQVAVDDSGERALTTNGLRPLPGLPATNTANRHGASYAFDPNRLPTEQDRVRTALLGNPVDIAMLPDSHTSWVVLRERDRIVELEHLPTGAIRQADRITTCKQPEHLELVRKGRRLLVGCNAGHALEIFALDSHELVRRIPLGARVSDLVVTPDGKQALLALPRGKTGALGVLDLDSFDLELHELSAPPHRIRITPDGHGATVISDSNKVAWVIR
jgi:hypothetical protein